MKLDCVYAWGHDLPALISSNSALIVAALLLSEIALRTFRKIHSRFHFDLCPIYQGTLLLSQF